MEVDFVMELLKKTMTPDCEYAERQLMEMQSLERFPVILLRISGLKEVNIAIKQAAVLYLKNLIIRYWNEKNYSRLICNTKSKTPPFKFHENDRSVIRDSILESTFDGPILITYHLGICINAMIRADFPDRWPEIVNQIDYYLQSINPEHWSGALIGLYQLVKRFEYTKNPSYSNALEILMPNTLKVMIKIVHGTNDTSLLMEKQILKIFYTLTEYSFPSNVLTNEVFAQWMEILHVEATKAVPEYPPGLDDERKALMPYWKVKKWTIRILKQLFFKYGSPTTSADTELAVWYLTTFTGGILEALFKILELQRNQNFVSPKVLIHTFGYLRQALSYSHSWKFLKPHLLTIIRDVAFPLMCHTDEIEDMFTNDPKTYLRFKTDIFSDSTYICTPVPAVSSFLVKACKRRKNVLTQVVQFCVHIMSDKKAQFYTPQQKDGALHMIGVLSKTLMKRNEYKNRIEELLIMCVLPEIQSSHNHLRARAFWVVNEFADYKIQNEQLLAQLINLMIDTLLNDSCLPVKFETAMGIQSFVVGQPLVNKYVTPKVNEIVLEILNLLRSTESEVLTTVIQILVSSFIEPLSSAINNIVQHLSTTFIEIFGDAHISDEKAITSTAILQTMESLINTVMDHEEILRSMESGILSVIFHIFRFGLIDFYEEAFSLVYHLTYKTISPLLWEAFRKMFDVFQNKGIEYFTDMMPALHNYITKDTETFLSNRYNILAIITMCKAILETNFEEDPGCYAAKLLEILLLQFKDCIDDVVQDFVFIALSRLTKEIRTSELRVMCLQVVIAALYYNPSIWYEVMKKMIGLGLQVPVHTNVSNWFLKLCINDANCFLGIHDRKLAIIGFCIILDMEPHKRATIISVEDILEMMSACLLLFDGLKKARLNKIALEEEIESESDGHCEDSNEEYEDLPSDVDETSEMFTPLEFRRKQKFIGISNTEEDNDSSDELSYIGEAPMEIFKTPLESNSVDEYIIFYDVIIKLTTTEEQLYMALASKLPETDMNIMKEVIGIATERKQNRFGFQFV